MRITPPIIGKHILCQICMRPVKETKDGRAKRHGIVRVRYQIRAYSGIPLGWRQIDKSHCKGTGKPVRRFEAKTYGKKET